MQLTAVFCSLPDEPLFSISALVILARTKVRKEVKLYARNYNIGRCTRCTNRFIGLSDDYKESSKENKKYNEACCLLHILAAINSKCVLVGIPLDGIICITINSCCNRFNITYQKKTGCDRIQAF